MRALHVIAGLDPRDGGPTYSVPSLCGALERAGCGADLLCVGEAGSIAPHRTAFRQFARGVPILGALRLSPGLRHAVRETARHSAIVHAHGLWLMPNVHAGMAARRAGKPLVVSPRGMLAAEALAFSPRRKRIFWRLVQRRAYAGAAAWHATSEQEAEEIRAFGIAAPIVVIPNGIDLPDGSADHAAVRPRRQLLFLSRLHAKKGLPVLIDAWAELVRDRPEWDLVIAGDDEGGHRGELEAQVAARAIPRVRFAGPVYGAAKQALLESSDLFVLPTRNENFGIAVAEALAAGIPAIVTRGAPWAGLETERCGWWIERGRDPLLAALRTGTALAAAERQAMGARGRAWMARDFGWDAIGARMMGAYRWLAQGGDRPETVRVD